MSDSKKTKERTASVTHKIMASIPSKGTKPELALRKELFLRGYRYRVNYKQLKGKPDIAFTKIKLAIFVDGDFWHGHNWVIRNYGSHEKEMERYSKYWQDKINNNIARDEKVNAYLRSQGWTVLRIWESEIKDDLNECANKVEQCYHELLEEQEK